jgi:hypothetical protein
MYFDHFIPLLLRILCDAHSILVTPFDARLALQCSDSRIYPLQLVIEVRIRVEHVLKNTYLPPLCLA